MIPETTLALTGTHHEQLRSHLFPADGLEAAAILVCTRTPGPRLRFLVRDVIFVPYSACSCRTREAITWPGEYVEKAIDIAEADDCAIVLIHSHPGGLFSFSDMDDESDRTLEEIGKELNVTRERVRQIESSAIKKLKHPKVGRKLKNYIED